MKRKSTSQKDTNKKQKKGNVCTYILHKMIILKNVLSDSEQINLYKKCVNFNKKYYQNLEELNPKDVNGYIKWLGEIINLNDETNCDIQKIHKDLTSIFQNVMEMVNIKYPNKKWIKDIETGFINKTNGIMCLSYPNTGYLDAHYDKWSDWNMLISIGGSSEFEYPRGNIRLDSGDIIIFNGNHKHHKVKLVDKCTNPLWEKNSYGFHRCCIQLRKLI